MEKENKVPDETTRGEEIIWSWGAGTDGQLGTGRLQDEHSPQLLRSLSGFGPISSLSCGGAHVIAIIAGGRVLTWGRGSSGQLGHGEIVDTNCFLPKEVKALEGIVITHVSAGWNHSGFVSGNGAIFTCGDGSFGQLGHGDYKSQSSPIRTSYFNDSHVKQVACGMRHTLILLREHQVYGFGSGKRGQLGISVENVKSTSIPQSIMGLTNVKIASISANGDHSAALSADGSLYTWGRGFGGASDAFEPRLLDAAFSFNHVALGWNHALLLTREGKLFMLGGDRHGILSDPHKTSLIRKTKEDVIQSIPDLLETDVLQIAAGAEHSALVTENGSVLAWGWGEHGQLGLGDTTDRTTPRVVNLGDKFDGKCVISRVYCGSGFTFVFRTNVLDCDIGQRISSISLSQVTYV